MEQRNYCFHERDALEISTHPHKCNMELKQTEERNAPLKTNQK